VGVTVDAWADALELSIRDDGSGGAVPTVGRGCAASPIVSTSSAGGSRWSVRAHATLLVTLPIEPADQLAGVLLDDRGRRKTLYLRKG